jgi:hypothetical protein
LRYDHVKSFEHALYLGDRFPYLAEYIVLCTSLLLLTVDGIRYTI